MTTTAATRVHEILAANGYRRVGTSNLWHSRQYPGAGLININNAIECESFTPTDMISETGWFYGFPPAGCPAPHVMIRDAMIDAGEHGDLEMVELLDELR